MMEDKLINKRHAAVLFKICRCFDNSNLEELRVMIHPEIDAIRISEENEFLEKEEETLYELSMLDSVHELLVGNLLI